MQILDGKLLAEDMIMEIKTKIQNLKINGMQPKLQIIQVGDNSESSTYVRMKRKKAEEIGAICNVDNLPVQATADELMILIDKYNKDQTVHGILVQMPLPDHLPKQKIINLINPAKDVDGLTAANQAKLLQNDPTGLVPATPRGIMIMLERYKIELNGKKVVVVGRSHLVGLPTALLCLHKNATVTICHSQTSNLMAETADADVLIIAVGRPKMITEEYVKPGATIIDVGISRTDDGLLGDVDLNSVIQKVKYVSPVPGGVGPMTVACLWQNVLDACLTINNFK